MAKSRKETFFPSFAGFPEEFGEECRMKRRSLAANRRFVSVEEIADPSTVEVSEGPRFLRLTVSREEAVWTLLRHASESLFDVYHKAREHRAFDLLESLPQIVRNLRDRGLDFETTIHDRQAVRIIQEDANRGFRLAQPIALALRPTPEAA